MRIKKKVDGNMAIDIDSCGLDVVGLSVCHQIAYLKALDMNSEKYYSCIPQKKLQRCISNVFIETLTDCGV